MIIRQSSINIVYPRISNYRKKYIMAEQELAEHFLPATILPIPDEVQESVPRIISQTKKEHSTLNIALNVATFTTVYDNDFPNNWDKCKQYLSERGTDVYTIVNTITDRKQYYVGLVLQLEFPDIEGDGLELLKGSILGDKSKDMGNPDDFSAKLTYVCKNKYYINITLENKKQFVLGNEKEAKYIVSPGSRNIVAATIDVNDRYASNHQLEYRSDQAAFDEIMSLTSKLLDGKLDNLILKGKYDNE